MYIQFWHIFIKYISYNHYIRLSSFSFVIKIIKIFLYEVMVIKTFFFVLDILWCFSIIYSKNNSKICYSPNGPTQPKKTACLRKILFVWTVSKMHTSTAFRYLSTFIRDIKKILTSLVCLNMPKYAQKWEFFLFFHIMLS